VGYADVHAGTSDAALDSTCEHSYGCWYYCDHHGYSTVQSDPGNCRYNYYNTLRIAKNLVRLENLIEKYGEDPPPKDWQIVRYSADRSRKQIEELGKKIILDFTQIIDLVENPRLADKFGTNNLYYTLYLLDETLRIDPEYNKEHLRELRKGFREQVAQLDETLSSLDGEKEDTYR
jgi:hypothetical protein